MKNCGIQYPILSQFSDELLQVSVCRFYGPYRDEPGNLCIAGHNFNDHSFFSNLYRLKIGDLICVNFEKGNSVVYSIYSIYETDFSDTSCTNQETNGIKEITLVTCNNLTGNRMIFKAKEII